MAGEPAPLDAVQAAILKSSAGRLASAPAPTVAHSGAIQEDLAVMADQSRRYTAGAAAGAAEAQFQLGATSTRISEAATQSQEQIERGIGIEQLGTQTREAQLAAQALEAQQRIEQINARTAIEAAAREAARIEREQAHQEKLARLAEERQARADAAADRERALAVERQRESAAKVFAKARQAMDPKYIQQYSAVLDQSMGYEDAILQMQNVVNQGGFGTGVMGSIQGAAAMAQFMGLARNYYKALNPDDPTLP